MQASEGAGLGDRRRQQPQYGGETPTHCSMNAFVFVPSAWNLIGTQSSSQSTWAIKPGLEHVGKKNVVSEMKMSILTVSLKGSFVFGFHSCLI